MGNCYLNKNQLPTTLPITSILSSWHYQLKQLGLKSQLPNYQLLGQKKCRYEYMYGRELSLISFKIYWCVCTVAWRPLRQRGILPYLIFFR
jgi:hypothetical protein